MSLGKVHLPHDPLIELLVCARHEILVFAKVFFNLGLLNSLGSTTWNSLKFLKQTNKQKSTYSIQKKLKIQICIR